MLLLENVRFEAAETSKDDAERGELADRLAALADVYVDDAFGAVHRKHASVFDVAERLPHYAGRLVARELDVLTRLTTDPERPYVVVLGGSKVSDKLAVIEALLPKVDRLLIGGGMCFTFLAAQGHGVGSSLLEADQVDTCRRLLAEAGDQIVLPVDVVCADRSSAPTPRPASSPAEAIPDDQMGLDVGPRTVELFGRELGGARTVFWNGPMGVFELAPFQEGTRGVAAAVGAVDGLSVVGGGDSAAAVRQLGLDEASYGHISTGGGASLEYLEGRELPGPRGARRLSRGADMARKDRTPSTREGRRPLIAGNWKMNMTHLDAIGLVQKLAFTLPETGARRRRGRRPAAVHRAAQRADAGDRRQAGRRLRRAGPLRRRTPAPTPARSAARCSPRWPASTSSSGTPSGGRMHGEDDAVVAAKAQAALRHGIVPIVCVGEGLEVRQAGEHVAHCTDQLDASLDGLTAEQVADGRASPTSRSGPSAPARWPRRRMRRRSAGHSGRGSPSGSDRRRPQPSVSSTAGR